VCVVVCVCMCVCVWCVCVVVCVCVCVCVYICTVRCQRTKLCSAVPVVSMSVHTSVVIRRNVRGNKILTFRLFIPFLSHFALHYHISTLRTTSIFIK
jgi:hypothetical protein